MEGIVNFDTSKLQEIAKWENEKSVPEHLRLTQWYGDYHMYEPKLNVSKMELEFRYQRMYRNPDISWLVRHVPAGNGLQGYEWIHFGTGAGILEDKNKIGVAAYNFDYLVEAGEIKKWENEVLEFATRIEKKEKGFLKEAELSKSNVAEGDGIRKEPAAQPILDGYIWTHYDDGSGILKDRFGEKAASYDLTTNEMNVCLPGEGSGEYHNYSGESYSLENVKRDVESYLANRIRCHAIGTYETVHKLPDNVRLTKWSSQRKTYYFDVDLSEAQLQKRYEGIVGNAKAVPIQQPPICR